MTARSPQVLSDRSVAWLRHLSHLDDRAVRGDGTADVAWTACALGLMAHRTPAWVEGYVGLLDRLIGPRMGPVTAGTPDVERLGGLLVLLGVRAMIAPGDDRWNRTDHRADGDTWTHTALADHVAGQWPADGAPLALTVAGLGLFLHDNRYGGDHHGRVFLPWWSPVGDQLLTSGWRSGSTADPDLPLIALAAGPQVPDGAGRLFDAAMASAHGPAGHLRAAILALAREWGRDDPGAGPDAAADEAGWPPDALTALADASGPGRLARLAAGPLERCGQVVDVDLPAVVLRRAEWTNDSLQVAVAVTEDQPAKRTMFRLVGTEPRMWYLTGIDGTTMDSAGAAVVVRVPHVNGTLEFTAGSY